MSQQDLHSITCTAGITSTSPEDKSTSRHIFSSSQETHITHWLQVQVSCSFPCLLLRTYSSYHQMSACQNSVSNSAQPSFTLSGGLAGENAGGGGNKKPWALSHWHCPVMGHWKTREQSDCAVAQQGFILLPHLSQMSQLLPVLPV